jgi:hypothetical protein
LPEDVIAAQAFVVSSLTHSPPYFRRQDNLVADALQRLAQNLFAPTADINVGGVYEVDAQVQSPMNQLYGFAFVCGFAAQVSAAKSNFAHPNSSSPQAPIFHEPSLLSQSFFVAKILAAVKAGRLMDVKFCESMALKQLRHCRFKIKVGDLP